MRSTLETGGTAPYPCATRQEISGGEAASFKSLDTTNKEDSIWMAVVDTPDTRPECSSVTPETAVRVSGTKVSPRPTDRTISGSMTPVR